MTVWLSRTEFKATSPDELMSVSDFETTKEASDMTTESVEDGTITSRAMYETGPV